ncbi:cyclohexanone monooxygenase, partial [Pseudomonadota bacterium]
YMRANGMTFVEPTTKVEDEWTQHVEDVADSTVLGQMKESWYFGANIPDKPRRACIYAAGAREFRKHCEDVERKSYPGVMMS